MAEVTALSPRPFVGFTLTLPDNLTVVEADLAPFNNTKEIIFLNRDPDNAIFVQVVSAGNPAALPAAAAVTEDNSTVIPAGGALSLCICSEGGRNAIGTTAYWNATGPGSQFILVFKAEAGLNLRLNITYVQNIGGGDGRGCGGC
jgi:hypothetical protein